MNQNNYNNIFKYIQISHLKFKNCWRWSCGSMVKNSCCICRRLRFSTIHPRVIQALGYLMHRSGLHSLLYACDAPGQLGSITHKNNTDNNKLFKLNPSGWREDKYISR